MAAANAPVPMWQNLASANVDVQVRPWAPQMKMENVKTEDDMLKMLEHKNFKLYVNLTVQEGDAKRRAGLRFLMGGNMNNTDPEQAHVLRTEPRPYGDAKGDDRKNVSGLQSVTAEFAAWIKGVEREVVNKAVAAGYMDTVKAGQRTPIIDQDFYELKENKREKQRAEAEAAGEPVPPPMDAYEYCLETNLFKSMIMPMMANKQVVPGKYVTNVSFKMHDAAVEDAAKEGRVLEPRLTSVYQLNKESTSMSRVTTPETLPRGSPLFCDVKMLTLGRNKGGVWRLPRVFEEVVVAHPESELGAACAAAYGGGGDAAPATVGGSSFAAYMPSITVTESSGGVKRARDDDGDVAAGSPKRAAPLGATDGAAEPSTAPGTFMVDAPEDDLNDYPDDFDQ